MNPGRRPSTLLDRTIAYLSPQWAMQRLAARTRLELSAQYRGADYNRLRADWILGTETSTPPSYELETLRNRCRDLNRNDPVASGATETMAINIVGRGLRPQSRIRADFLGISETEARRLQKQVEGIWADWVLNADSANRLHFDELQFLALRKVVEDGEILALPIMAPEPWRPIKRAVELIEADRLQAPMNQLAKLAKDTGIEVGARGEPTAYWITKADYQGTGTMDAERIDARDRQGRPKVLHIFRTQRPGQLRGIPYFAPVISYFKDLADYLEAEVVAARVAACLAVFVTRADPAYAAMGASNATEVSTDKRIQHIEPGLINYLGLGEQIQVVDPKRGGETFNAFVEGVLRVIGISLGLPYELLVKDFSKTNYSSARAALLEGRRMFTTWRSWFALKFCQPIWDLVLEEAWLRGQFDAPKFYENRREFTRCAWIGGGWGWVDPNKEIDASKKSIDYGLSTLAKEAAAQGEDWEELLEQRKREQDRTAELGLDLSVNGQAPVAPEVPEGDEDAQTE